MRFFSRLFITTCVVGLIGFNLIWNSVPDEIYCREGEEIKIETWAPLTLEVGDSVQCSLLGIFPLKEIAIHEEKPTTVYASGMQVGIYGTTEGVLVTKIENNSACKGLLHEGDYVVSLNDKKIVSKEIFQEDIQKLPKQKVDLLILRNGQYEQVSIETKKNEQGNGYLGIWIQDDLAGLGTLTFVSSENKFGALGHGIASGAKEQLLEMQSGKLYEVSVLGVERGEVGNPGEIKGVIAYGLAKQLGEISYNGDNGICGSIEENVADDIKAESFACEVGYKQEMKKGKAYILSHVTGELEWYEIEIEKIDTNPTNENKGIRFVVRDEQLLDVAGGIVQGMSGSPIIQDGKIVGAVTHVLVNDPTRGYGIFIESMLNHEK